MTNKTISITVPALNEEKNLKDTLDMLVEATENWDKVEIIVIDDGSTDKTSEVAKSFSKDFDIRLINHDVPKGRGFSINEGFSSSKYEYIICFNGKKDTTVEEVKKILNTPRTSDIVISYQDNTHERPFIRRLFSYTYTFIINLFFQKDIKYYNGSILLKKSDFQEVKIKTSSYAYETELILKLLKKGKSFQQVPVIDIFEPNRKTRCLSLKNITGVFLTFLRLFYEVKLT
jgi:glycosyltransferase involved in cell wall biosynthesis